MSELPLHERMELKFQQKEMKDKKRRDQLLVERHQMMLQRKCVTSQDVRDHRRRIEEFKQKRRADREAEEIRQNH